MEIDAPPIHKFDRLDSTQSELRRQLDAEPSLPWGVTVWALEQTAGRGRRGRSWVSRRGDTLMWSTWTPTTLAPEKAPLLSLAAGLSLAETLDPWVNTRLKWPNDVLTPDERKLAGILAEGVWHGSRLTGVIIGIGLNLRSPELPESNDVTITPGALDSWRQIPIEDGPIMIHPWRKRVRDHQRRLEQGDLEDFAAAYNARLLAKTRLVRLRMVESGDTVGYIEGISRTGKLRFRRESDDVIISVESGELDLGDQPVNPTSKVKN